MSFALRAPDAQFRRAAMRRALDILIAVAVLAGGTAAAEAAFTTEGCLAQKRKSWSNLRKCLGTEEAKALQGKVPDLAKCQTKHQSKLASITGKAEAVAVPCRYGDNGDGTATDYDSGLQWEQKTNDGNFLHDKDNTYSWSTGGTTPSGTAFTVFLGSLNNGTSGDGTATSGCFAGHCDWRLPAIEELMGIVDETQGDCGGGSGPCIDQAVFGPTVANGYWSATTLAVNTGNAWLAIFVNGNVTISGKSSNFYVRAVRSGL